ncbi:unannotated protein [freshwater metagenome]|uniref:Unannotated protein n=1 Tax=freshwater metagenome TaxID=449393 RepID=A0A6J7E9K0_9ZZZZ|nr:hypothetical protein [Actinomycetota bacterium]
MKKTWLTAVSVAGVLGTGSAAMMASAVMNAGSTSPNTAPVPGQNGADTPAPRTVVYSVGDAAHITLSSAGGVLSVISTEPSVGWSVVSTSQAGPTVTVQLTDGMRLVTFTATSNGEQVNASVAAAFMTPTSDGTTVSTPELIEQTNATTGPTVSAPWNHNESEAPAPAQAQPPAQTHSTPTEAAERPSSTSPAVTTTPPQIIPPSSTTAPSSAGTWHEDDGHQTESTDNGAEHDDD